MDNQEVQAELTNPLLSQIREMKTRLAERISSVETRLIGKIDSLEKVYNSRLNQYDRFLWALLAGFISIFIRSFF